jgi:hypothetical protein
MNHQSEETNESFFLLLQNSIASLENFITGANEDDGNEESIQTGTTIGALICKNDETSNNDSIFAVCDTRLSMTIGGVTFDKGYDVKFRAIENTGKIILYAGTVQYCQDAITQFIKDKAYNQTMFLMATYLEQLECVKRGHAKFILAGYDSDSMGSVPRILEITKTGWKEQISQSFLGSGGKHASDYISINLGKCSIIDLMHDATDYAASKDKKSGGQSYVIQITPNKEMRLLVRNLSMTQDILK